MTGVSSALHVFGERQHTASATSRSGRYEVPNVEGVGRGERGERLSTKALSFGRSAKLVAAHLLQLYSINVASNINGAANERADGQAKYFHVW